MATPHYNYYPPAGQVIDLNDSSATWDGRAWKKGGKVYTIPSTHRLIGKPGTSMNGWTYDWSKHAWMEPTSSTPVRPGPIVRPNPAPNPTPAPQPQPPAPAPEKKETNMEKSTVLDALIKHPVAPVLGGVLLLAAHFTDEPQPPAFPAGLPDPMRDQWQMIYNQNQQKFQRRMDLYERIGMVLLGYAETRALLDAAQKK